MKLTTIAWRNVGRNRRRSALSITAIAIATLAVVMLFSLLEGMKYDMSSNLINFYIGEIRLRHRDYDRYEHLSPLHLSVKDAEQVLTRLDVLPEVAAATGRLAVPGAVFRETERTALQTVGVDFAREAHYSDIASRVVAGDLERVISGPGEGERITPALVGNRVLSRLGIEVGDTFTVVVRTALRGSNAMTFQAAAVADFPVAGLNEISVWVPIERVQRLAQMPGQVGEIFVKVTPRTAPEQAVTAMRGVAPELAVAHWSSIETVYSFLEMAEVAYSVMAVIFLVLASTVIINTTMMVIFERRQEIGTLEAMGMSTASLMQMFFLEALILGLIGASAGLAGGLGLAALLGEIGIDFSKAMEGVDMQISAILYPRINFNSSVKVFFFAVAVSGLTSYIPTRRITRMEPVAALRDE